MADRYCVGCGDDLGRAYSPPIRCDSCCTAANMQPQIDALTRERDEAREDRDSAEATIARLQAEVARVRAVLSALDRADAIDRRELDIDEPALLAELDAIRALLPPTGDTLTEGWLALRVQAELAERGGVLGEVRAERARQDTKFGEQNHVDTVHTTRISHGIAASDVYRRCLQARPSWALILLEEVSEAIEAIGDVTALRAELVQVGAVAVAWVEALDRRQSGAT